MEEAGIAYRVAPDQLDELIDRARTEAWQDLSLAGPETARPLDVVNWNPSRRWAKRNFCIDETIPGLVRKIGMIGSLTSLALAGHELAGADASHLGNSLPSLTSLDLSRNELGDRGASFIARSFPAMTSLSLSGNGIGSSGTTAIARSLRSLQTLDLSFNPIGVDGCAAIAATLDELVELNLMSCMLSARGAGLIAPSLERLTSLGLAFNDLDDEVMVRLGHLRSLRTLNVRNTNITDSGAIAIARAMPELQALNLAGNRISRTGLTHLQAFRNLESLTLDHVGVDDESGVRALTSLSSLTSLSVSYCGLNEMAAERLAWSLDRLTSLRMVFNKIGVGGARAISSIKGLTSLELSFCNIGDEGVIAIATSLNNLTLLSASSNDIGPAGARSIGESLTKLRSLELGGNEVGSPDVVVMARSLTELRSLYLWGNKVGDEGAVAIAESLSNLNELGLRECEVGDKGGLAIASGLPLLRSLTLGKNPLGMGAVEAIAKSLAHLTYLNLDSVGLGDRGAQLIAAFSPKIRALSLDQNEIGDDGVRTLASSLKSLRGLYLAGNQIGDDGAEAIAQSLGVLGALDALDLDDNVVGDRGAQAIAGRLDRLTRLNLAKNRIGVQGVKAILDAFSAAERSGQLSTLNLRDNPHSGELLPKELFETSDAGAILAAYRGYAAAQSKEALLPLNEVKLLVVGNEAVGKTSLIRYLVQGRPRDPAEAKTPGILQHERIEVLGWSPQQCQVRMNVWDFGGQEMMRGTHRFFLTDRSLYLLVLEDRRQDDRSIHEWMKTIRNRAKTSPIIVVINKSDAGKQDLRLDERGLQEAYPNIVGFLRTSCDRNDWARISIEGLRAKIVETIVGSSHLKHVQDPIPENWLKVKASLSALGKQHSVLPHRDFVGICERPGDGLDPILDEGEQRALLRVLHELGVVVAHGLERDAPAVRREINLLDPNWLTGAVYRIMDKASSVEQEGEFSRQQLGLWLDGRLYPPERHEFILEMMQDPDIGLCFRLPGEGEERYLLPEALPANRRFYGIWPEDSLRFRFLYSYLPPGLIPRFIVQSHKNLTPERSRWRTGVILRVRDCVALVLADVDQRRIDVQVTDGAPGLRRAALNVILSDLEAVHALNPEAEPVAVVPLPDRPDVHVPYAHLLMLEHKKGPDEEFYPQGVAQAYRVRDLLEGVRLDRFQAPAGLQIAPGAAKEHVVILVHGIRTRALWQNELRKTLQVAGFVVEPTNYGYFDVVRFLFPWQLFAGGIVEDVTRQVRDILVLHKGADCSIIAHSFGTYVVARMLRDHSDLEFKRIIFCGSVVSDRFRFAEYRGRFNVPAVNEVGTRDFWPVMAETVTFGYGAAGTYGFRRGAVHDRWHNGKAHGDFLNPDFCRTYWVPFLSKGEILENDAKAERPRWWLGLVSILKPKYVVLVAIGVALWSWLHASGLGIGFFK